MTAPTEVPIEPPEEDPRMGLAQPTQPPASEPHGSQPVAEQQPGAVPVEPLPDGAVPDGAVPDGAAPIEAPLAELSATQHVVGEAVAGEPVPAVEMAAEEVAPKPRTSLDNLKFAVIGLIVLAAAVVAFGQLSGATTSEGSSDADAAALAVIASDIVTSAKNDGGAVDAIGGYLPGTGMVLTVELNDIGVATTADWVSDHLGPFAETLAIMPADESIVVTINDRVQGTARVWSLPVSALGSSVGDWNQLVAPATFESNEVAVVEAAPEADPTDEGEPTDEDSPFAEVASGADGEPIDEEAIEDDPEADPFADDSFGAAPIENEAEPIEAGTEEDLDPAGDEPATDDETGETGETGDGAIDLGDGEAGEPVVVSAFEDSDSFSPIFGSWVLADGIYSQSDATGFGYSSAYAGFVPDVYDVSVDMRAPNGDLNAGIIYGMPERTRKHGGKVIDLTAESTYLRWGEYAEDTGDWAFIGGAPIEPGLAQDEWQNLKLEVRPEGTTVLLNGQFITTLDPVEAGGHVALVVSIANVEFREFIVTAPEGAPIDPTSGGGASAEADDYVVFDSELREWTLLSGSWTAQDGVLSQGNGQAYDQMVHFSNFEQDDYRVQVDLRAKPDSIFSGGLLFNVSSFGQRPNSQLFDIVDDGQVIRWAGYDQNGVFSYVGGLRTPAGFEPDEWHTLAVEVRDGRASFFVDGAQVGVSDDVGSAGYVGLVTSLAAMEFRDFAVTPLG